MTKLLVFVILCGSGLAQKTTLGEVDANQKKAAADQAAASKNSDAKQADGVKQVLSGQRAAEHSARKRSVAARESDALTRYKEEQRLEAIETALAQADRDKIEATKQAAREAQASHDEYMALARQTFGGLILAGLLAVARMTYSTVTGRRRHAAEQAARFEAAEAAKTQDAKLDQIHTLVNSQMTEALTNELDQRKANVVLLRKIAGRRPNGEELGLIEAQNVKIAELESALRDRLKQTSEASQQLNSDMNKGGHQPRA